MASPVDKQRTFPRFRIVWSAQSAPKVNWWRGLVGLQTRGGKHRGFVLHFAVRGALFWSGSLAAITFAVGTAAGAYVLARNPYNRIGYLDLVLPTRWGELRSKRGQTLIDEGLNEIKAQRFGAGIMMLAHGLKLEPSNVAARIVLGQMYAQAGYVHRAMNIFRIGLPYALRNERYVDYTFKLAEFLEDDALVLEMVAEIEAKPGAVDGAGMRRLRDRGAAALVRQESFEEVIALWQASQNSPSMALNSAWARALAGLGQGEQAMAAVEADPSNFGLFGEPWELLMELALGADNPQVGKKAADAWVALDATDFSAATSRIVYLVRAGLREDWIKALDNYFLRFGLNEAARVTLMKKLEPVGNAEVIREVWAQVESVGQISVMARIAQVQNLIMAGDVASAAKEFEKARQQIESEGGQNKKWVDGTRVLLDLLQTRSASSLSQLKGFCAEFSLAPDAYRMLVLGLLNNGLHDEASEIALVARNRFPSIRDVPDLVRDAKVITATEVLATSRARESDRVVANPEAKREWATLQEDILAKRWSSAVERIAKVEQSPLANELGDRLLYDRVLIHGYLSNQTELSWYMRRLMEGARMDPSRLRELATRLHGAGHEDGALTLLREILREHPNAKWAATLRQKWLEELKTAPLKGEQS